MNKESVKIEYIHRATKIFTECIFDNFDEYLHWLDRNRGMVVMRVVRP